MDPTVSTFVLGILNASTLILVALINTNNAKEKKKEEERYQLRLQHEKLSMELMQCDCKLSVLTAKKIAGEHINGDLEKAIDATEQSYANYVDFVNEEMACQVAKI